ncbi:MAG: TIGR02147 family protein [Chitinivibrionales bacterium]|nr:TIGR02147 family protein [Chitinivibrionales bacterium]
MPSIFSYMDYRDFLRDAFAEKKKGFAGYSYRLFSQKAGFKSPNILKLVTTGARNLTKESVFKFAKALGLNRAEGEYFENLVFFNQSGTLDEKNSYLTHLMKFRLKGDPRRIEEAEYKYYSAWYHPVIRELVTASTFTGDYKKLGNALIPAISALEAQRSVELLLNLNFIKKKPGGRYEKTAVSLTTGPQVKSVAVANYHKAMMGLAADSIERIAAPERDISSCTVHVSDDTYKAIIARVQQLRKEICLMAEADPAPQKVVQVNFQLFPLSRPSQQERRS